LLSTFQADVEHDEKEEMTVEIENVHKTYLLGVEGVPALRYVKKLLRVEERYLLKKGWRNEDSAPSLLEDSTEN
jgi:hypothetical protein